MLENWLDESDENRRLYAQEDLIIETTEAIWERMHQLGISKKDLSEKMGRSKAYISQILSGSRNMTLRTLADIAYHLDIEPKIEFTDIEKDETHQLFVERGKPLSETLVIVAGQDDQWSTPNVIPHRRRLKAVA